MKMLFVSEQFYMGSEYSIPASTPNFEYIHIAFYICRLFFIILLLSSLFSFFFYLPWYVFFFSLIFSSFFLFSHSFPSLSLFHFLLLISLYSLPPFFSFSLVQPLLFVLSFSSFTPSLLFLSLFFTWFFIINEILNKSLHLLSVILASKCDTAEKPLEYLL